MEVWKELPKQFGSYMVSSFGNIKSLSKEKFCKGGRYLTPERILKPGIVNGYQKVLIYTKGIRKQYFVHRLVCIAFFGESGLVVNHKNGIKTDNRLENLEWVSQSENTKHAFLTGLSKSRIISDKGVQSIRESKFKKVIDTTTGFIYNSLSEASFKNNINVSTLSLMLNGKTKNKTTLIYAITKDSVRA